MNMRQASTICRAWSPCGSAEAIAAAAAPALSSLPVGNATEQLLRPAGRPTSPRDSTGTPRVSCPMIKMD